MRTGTACLICGDIAPMDYVEGYLPIVVCDKCKKAVMFIRDMTQNPGKKQSKQIALSTMREIPKCCVECPMERDYVGGLHMCEAKNEAVQFDHLYEKRPDWCPWKEV